MSAESRVKTVFAQLASEIDPAPEAWHTLVTRVRARQRRHHVSVLLLVLLIVGGGTFGIVLSWSRSGSSLIKPITDQTESGPVLVRGTLVAVGGPAVITPGGAESSQLHPYGRTLFYFVPTGARGSTTSVTTDATGRFSVRLVPGSYRMVWPGGGSVFAVGQPDQRVISVIMVTTRGPNQFQLFSPIP